MKAAFIERFGGPEVLQYGDVPDPVAGPCEVVVVVGGASVDAEDWQVRMGEYKQASFPRILGPDFSGTVGGLGGGVSDLAVGDTMFGVLEGGREGAYAEMFAIK